MIHIIVRIALLLLISVCYAVHASVTVIESTPSRLVLSWKMEDFDTVTVKEARGAVTALSFNGGYIVTGDSGASLIPGFSFYAGVPERGSVKVTLEPQEVSVLRINNPLQKRISAKSNLDPAFSSRWISDPSYTFLRDYRAVSLVIRPVSDMGRGKIQLLKSARIIIDFPASAYSGAKWEPRSDYERMARRLLLNFSVSQGWRQNEKRALRKSFDVQDPFPFTANQPLASFRVSGGGRGNEASTNGNTLIKISGQRIRKLFGNNVKVNSVALYASVKGELGEAVPEFGEIPSGVFEVPLLRPGKSDIVSNDDYFIAYVSGPSDWSYSSDSLKYSFALNRYDDKRTYWLTVKGSGTGESMDSFTGFASAASVSEDFEANVYMREPRTLSVRSKVRAGDKEEGGGIDWVWKRFDTGRADTTVTLDLPGLLVKKSGSIYFDISSYGSVEARLGSTTLCANCAGNTWVQINNWSSDRLLIDGRNARTAELNGIHIRYRRPVTMPAAIGDKLEIFSPAAPGVTAYKLAKTGKDTAYIVRVPLDEKNVSLISDTVRAAGYTWSDMGNQGTRYVVMSKNSIVDYSDSLNEVNYKAGGKFHVRDLRNTANSSDYLIVTHQEFLAAALKLAEHKAGVGFISPKVVTLDDMQNQFGGGNMDPASLRNFLLYVHRNWNSGDNLAYVAFIGAGHYDYKNISTGQTNFMPIAYRTDGSLNSRNYNKVTDDYFVFFNTQLHPDNQHFGYYFLGRLPARSSSEAFDMVDKIIEMENPAEANFDSWRNRVLLTADDDQQGDKKDLQQPYHYSSSEDVAKIIWKNRPSADIRKVYLFEYPWDNYYAKPGAARAFINEINNGSAAVNWFGHGSDNQLADELMFSKNDVLALHNRKRYPVFSFFSCSVGKFDIPGNDCLSALLVRQPRAGAIGVISAARSTYAVYNEKLAEPFFEALFHSTDNMSIGAALQYGKYKYQYIDNRYYVLLGDPSITTSRQNRKVDLFIEDFTGKPLDTLKALQRIKIKGYVNYTSGQRDKSFTTMKDDSAFVNVTLFNAPDTAVRRKDGGAFSDPKYELPGAPIFSAKVRVNEGWFEDTTLRLPMNLPFGKPGVRLIAYAFKDTLTGIGHKTGLIFSGSENSNISDTTGPKISVRPASLTDTAGLFVKNRVIAQLPLEIEIRVEDENGINRIGSGPDEGFTLEVSGSLSKRNINYCFEPWKGNSREYRGTYKFEENALKSGVHELIISAQDLLGNISRQTFTLEILDPTDIKLDHVLNIPNPVKMGRKTRFYYYHSNTDNYNNTDMTTIIRVYSLGGRLLKVIRNPQNGYEWIPRDERGNILTPNVYLYQVSVTSASLGKTTKSKIKKLVVHPPR